MLIPYGSCDAEYETVADEIILSVTFDSHMDHVGPYGPIKVKV